ncbi:MAG: bifunctional oligoribonuclease/PAP phosphatase NrnA [Clostridia bacterium]|nr:bifunctional oligoribonuclease/PAP phosphatase NrnA [Clostridia bacterium]
MLRIDYESASQFLLEKDNFLVVCHACPDGDTIGSSAALVMLLRKKGKTAWAYCPDPVPEKLSLFAGKDIFTTDIPENAVKISVDVATPAMLGDKQDFFGVFDLSIDHHKINSIPCERLLIRDNFISNAEIIADLYDELSVGIDKKAAVCLYAGISSDSGGFRYSNTRPQTMRLAARLMETGIDFAAINRQLFDKMTPPVLALMKAAYGSVELYYGGKLAIVTISKEEYEQSGALDTDLDEIKSIPRRIDGVEVSAMIRPKGDKAQVSLRSNEYFDVAAFCREMGGGGHTRAAAFRTDGTPEQAKAMLIKALEGRL